MDLKSPSPLFENDQQVALQLIGHPQILPRNLQVHSRDGNLFIDGEVDTWFAKQMAQESLRKIDGIGLINNRLKVVR